MSTSPVRSSWAESDPLLTEYYDTEWGMPIFDEVGLFERLSLEAFQSGLSWLIILRRRPAFREAFQGFEPEAVAALDESAIDRLLQDASIIRNRAKINATIENARAILALRQSSVSLADVVWSYMPERSPQPLVERDVPSSSKESIALAKTLKKLGFRFVGPTTVYALMTAIGIADGHLLGSHRRGCSGLWHLDGTRTAEGKAIAKKAVLGASSLLTAPHTGLS